MANDTVSMTDLFPACRQILDELLVPIHYSDLTRAGIKELGYSTNDVNWQRQIEDVREKMVKAGKNGAFYTGSPSCLVVVRRWFKNPVQESFLLPDEGVYILPDLTLSIEGAKEALIRAPYMIKKNPKAPSHRLNEARAKGLIVEKHVSGFFEKHWPNFFYRPDNHKQWRTPCNHDFKIKIGDKAYLVDVSGRKLNGEYGSEKKPTDLHIMADVQNNTVWMKSIIPKSRYGKNINIETNGISVKRLIVRLNCQKAGIDWMSINNQIKGE